MAEGAVVIGDFRNLVTKSNVFLTEKEIAVFRKKHYLQQESYISGRVAAKQAIINFMEKEIGKVINYQQINIISAPHPIVEIEGFFSEKLNLSISHHKNIAFAVVNSYYPVGIDVEPIFCPTNRMLKNVCQDSEIKLFASGWENNISLIFTCIWAIKEAVMKLSKIGMKMGFYNIKIIKVPAFNNINEDEFIVHYYDQIQVRQAKLKLRVCESLIFSLACVCDNLVHCSYHSYKDKKLTYIDRRIF